MILAMSVHPFCPSSHYINQLLNDNAKSLCIKMSGLVPSLNTSSWATYKVAKISCTQLRRRDKWTPAHTEKIQGKVIHEEENLSLLQAQIMLEQRRCL